MSLDELQLHCNQILDDASISEEDRIEKTEDYVRNYFSNDNIAENDLERLVLDILWRHRQGDAPKKKQKKPLVSGAKVQIKTPSAPEIESLKELRLADIEPKQQHNEQNNNNNNTEQQPQLQLTPNKPKSEQPNSLDIDWEEWDIAEDDYGNGMSSVDLLRSILGEHNNPTDIEKLLEKHDFNISMVLETLFSTEEPSSEEFDDDDSPKSRELCKYYAQYGECLRADCMYRHDLSSRICKFWLRGVCLAGESCKFLHEIPAEVIEKHIPVTQEPVKPQPKLDLQSEEAFPAIGQSKKKKKNQYVTPDHTVPTYSESTYTSPSYSEPNYSGSVATPPASLPVSSEPGKFKFNPKSSFTFNPTSVSTKTPVVPVSKVLSRRKVQLKRPTTIPWENPESEANKAYISLRNSAAKHADMRNKYLELGAKSWYSNEAGTAKMMSIKGQKHNTMMMEKYEQAATFLFELRKQQGAEVFVDLHGLDLDQVTDKLQEYLDIIEEEDCDNYRPLYAICGYGRYYKINPNREDKMTQTVKEYLKRKGYEFTDYSSAANKYGKIIAIDPWSRPK